MAKMIYEISPHPTRKRVQLGKEDDDVRKKKEWANLQTTNSAEEPKIPPSKGGQACPNKAIRGAPEKPGGRNWGKDGLTSHKKLLDKGAHS